jgi:hypothetical protein
MSEGWKEYGERYRNFRENVNEVRAATGYQPPAKLSFYARLSSWLRRLFR